MAMSQALPQERLLRVSRQNPCTVCGHADWCGYNERVRVCMRVPSPHPARNGGWVHPWGSERPELSFSPPPPPQPRASLARRDRVYRELLKVLHLSEDHRRNLEGRGLPESLIERNAYRTLPLGDRIAIASAVASFLPDGALLGVPGFFQARNGAWVMGGKPGILIPVRDLEGRIQGLQVRVDDADATSGRYRWVSSADKPGGASSGVPAHVAQPETLSDPRLWVTEGPLKADVAAHFLAARVIGVAGVGNFHDVPKIVRAVFGRGTRGEVVVAYDADAASNPVVAEHRKSLVAELLRLGCHVSIASWQKSRGKGIDDLLRDGGRPRLYRIS